MKEIVLCAHCNKEVEEVDFEGIGNKVVKPYIIDISDLRKIFCSAIFIFGTIEKEQEDSISKAGNKMANFAIGVASIFLLLAIFAPQITKLY